MLPIKRLYYLIFTALLLISCGSDDSTGTSDDDPIVPDFLGEVVWIKTFGGTGDEDAISVVQSNDGGYMVLASTKSMDGDITGKSTTDLDYWLLKLDENGEKLWDKTYGGSEQDKASSISKTSDGGYIISGFTASIDGDVTENAGFHDYWIVKINSSGDIQWEKSFGFIGQDQAFKVIETAEGGYIAIGFLDVGQSGGEGNDATESSDSTRNSLHSLGDYWAIKMDSNGNKIWRRYFGGSHVDQGKDVLQTPDGGFLLIGISESSDFDITNAYGANDFWAIKINADGDLIWENSFGGSESEFAYSITNTTDGNFIVIGDTRSSDFNVSTPLGNADVWAVKFNSSNGNIIWENTFGGLEFDSARGIIQLENGKYAIAGNSRSSNNHVENNNGSNDAWMFIIDEDGNLEFEKNIGGSQIDFANNLTETTNNEIIFVGNTDSNDIDITINKGGKDILIYKMK
ncbi:MAG: hypothetical protein L3J09_06890 [Flavobacteriaceae bacterium]|nr:hypothetical protein [Flavobacteriaceae bacterium]